MVKDIRNIAVLGHGSEGKTTLVESMLYAAGVIDRQGRVEDQAPYFHQRVRGAH